MMNNLTIVIWFPPITKLELESRLLVKLQSLETKWSSWETRVFSQLAVSPKIESRCAHFKSTASLMIVTLGKFSSKMRRLRMILSLAVKKLCWALLLRRKIWEVNGPSQMRLPFWPFLVRPSRMIRSAVWSLVRLCRSLQPINLCMVRKVKHPPIPFSITYKLNFLKNLKPSMS